MQVEPPTTMTGGPVEPHDEPEVLLGAVYSVIRGQDGDEPDDWSVFHEGSDPDLARLAYGSADPGDGFVQLLQDGVVVDTKRNALAPVTAAEEPKPGEQAKAFDQRPFTVVKAVVDDNDCDQIKVGFGGAWELDLHQLEDIAQFEKLQLGYSLTLQVEAEVVDRAAKSKHTKEGDQVVTGVVKLKIVDVYQPSPEQLT